VTSPISLEFDRYGERSHKPAIVIAHGLFGSSSNWRGIARHLGAQFEVYALDMRNHGQSPWSDDHSYEALAADIGKFIKTQIGTPAVVVGHSMGGKSAMTLALSQPELVRGVIVVDIAPVVYGHTHDGFIEAMQAVNTAELTSRKDADAALQASISEVAVRQFLLQNLVPAKPGYRWRINLDVLEQFMDGLTGFDVSPQSQFTGEALFIYGALSDYVTTASHPAIARHFPAHTLLEVGDAGHWVHAEQAPTVTEAIERFTLRV